MSNQLVNEQVHECSELGQINAVPEVLDILTKAVLSELNELEEEQENLRHEATDVAEILEKRSFNGNRKDEWSKESKDVESHDQVEECFGLDELIVNKFLN